MPAKGGGNRAELKIQDAFKAGNIKAVVPVMGANGSSSGVQDKACAALANLASKNDENRTAIALRARTFHLSQLADPGWQGQLT
jgi:hypothetical protein